MISGKAVNDVAESFNKTLFVADPMMDINIEVMF